MRHIYRLLTLLFLLAGTACYSQPAPQPVIIDSQSRTAPSLQVFQANERTFRVYFRDGTNPVNVASYVPFMSWSLTNTATTVSTSSWSYVTAASGVVDFTFSPAAINTNGTFIYEVGLAGLPLVYRQGVFQILRSPYASGAGPVTFGTNQPYVSSLSSTGAVSGPITITGQAVTQSNNVFNFAAATGSSGKLYRVYGTGLVSVANEYGPAALMSVDVDGIRSGLATGTPLYVESGTGTLVAASLDPYMTGALSSNAFIGAVSLSTLSGSVASVSGSLTGYAAKVGAVFHGPVTAASFHVASGPAITASGTTNILIGGVRAMLEGEASGGGGTDTGAVQKVGDVMTGALSVTNDGDGAFAKFDNDGTLLLQAVGGDDYLQLDLDPNTFSNMWWPRGVTIYGDEVVYATNTAGGASSQQRSAYIAYPTASDEPLLGLSKLKVVGGGSASTNWMYATMRIGTPTKTNATTVNYSLARVSSDGDRYTIWDEYFDGSGSGLDADLFDGKDSTYFLSGSATPYALTPAGTVVLATANGYWQSLTPAAPTVIQIQQALTGDVESIRLDLYAGTNSITFATSNTYGASSLSINATNTTAILFDSPFKETLWRVHQLSP